MTNDKGQKLDSADAVRVEKEEGGAGWTAMLKDIVELLVRAGFWALLIYLFVFQVSMVDGSSMQPNFQTDDRLLIDKLTLRLSGLHRFDVIVFQAVDRGKPPLTTRDYIKRVIGFPGERVEIRGDEVLIDGKELKQAGFKHERNFGGAETYVVPPEHYFVMGDNRPGSSDSRQQDIGFVPASQIRGLVRARFWPWNRRDWFERQ